MKKTFLKLLFCALVPVLSFSLALIIGWYIESTSSIYEVPFSDAVSALKSIIPIFACGTILGTCFTYINFDCN